ncbi:MAG: hypothetical protein L0G64_13295, partial [Acinetobacter sp.]|nr:hypothetical protein [Acinetobacter sp.]
LKKYENIHRGIAPLYIDNQPCNLENYRKICLPLCDFFNVSQEALKIRLKELGYAKFAIDEKTIKKEKNSLSFLDF